MNSDYKWCMFFTSVIGLWPYTGKKLRLLQNGIVSLVFSMFTTAQVKGFLDQIRLYWRTSNEEILQIMQMHASDGKRLVIIFAAFVYPSGCMIMLYHISPIILDIILPLNESRPVMFPVETDFLLDEEQHPILNNFLIYFSLIIGVTILVGTESLMIMISAHIAGLYGVASHYFQKAVLVETSAPCCRRDCSNKKSMPYIVNGVAVHQMTHQYNTNWYETSIATQKLLQLIILNSNRGFKFNFMSIFAPSIEGFAVLLKSSVSYFTALLSMQ
ncbi:uncharacterized protein LOC143264887 [Megachile rotundata]|uniref:uncharacterized protein LOC143264887 n=1 Tax=Megachile rotundata TaxID=143995 RepID=UPI003FD17E8C